MKPIFNVLTLPFACLYLALVKMRLFLFRSNILERSQLKQPVICVGNLAVGGTGKSPFVIYLCRWLLEQGYKPAILTRGYRSGLASKDTAVLLAGELVMRKSNEANALHADEATLQSTHLPQVPVVVGADRYQSASFYLSQNPAPDIWIMDDGFQHLKLHRNLDIVLLGKLKTDEKFLIFPAGLYREPLSHAQRAQLVFADATSDRHACAVAKQSLVQKPLHTYTIDALSVRQVSGPEIALEVGQTVQLVCAIANPERFVLSAKQLGFQVGARHFLPDHKVINQSDLRDVNGDNSPILITEKDYFRQKSFWSAQKRPIYVLEITLRLNEQAKASLLSQLSAILP